MFPSMVGVMLFTTFSGCVFPVTFTIPGLAGSTVMVQVLTQTSQEKKEIPPHPVCIMSNCKVPSPTLRMPQQDCE